MKRHYTHTFVVSVFTFVLAIVLFANCGKTAMRDDDCIVMLDSAAMYMHEMDYVSAKAKLKHILGHAANKMHRMSADLLMMRICVLLGESKEFYDYRSDAEKCMIALKKEEPYIEGRKILILHYLQSSFYRVSAFYFQLMRKEQEMHEILDSLAAHPEWNDADTLSFINRIEPAEMLASQRKVAVASFLTSSGKYEEAIDSLAEVLHKINMHHLKYNKHVSPDDTLTLTGAITDSISKEMTWIKDPDIVALPEWMAMLREQLSIVYGAMGDKTSSNYNRNIYFDILDVTREDMQVQQRREKLVSEGRKLNLYMFMFIVFAVVVIIATIISSRRVTYSSKIKHDKLSLCLDICSRMANGEDVDDDVHRLLPEVNGDWKDIHLIYNNIKPFEHELLTMLQIFHGWISRNTGLYIQYVEKQENIEGEIYMEQRRMEENKRKHIDRATAISIVQGITPFLDRAIHQVEKGAEYVDVNLLREYIVKINDYNDVLGHWVKVRQGSVTLNVENFSLQPLLETMSKGSRVFESKNITLSVDKSEAVVKADKALTLFMMNTLLDNARKYTPEGGSVALNVEECEQYVEVSVSDTGNGLSAEDQDKINNAKVYDSSQIGLTNDDNGQIRSNKGFGFGLMNCRGIIEKYRKTGKMFEVCQFGVESTLGKGARFFFRLPKGVMRTIGILLLFLLNLNMYSQNAEMYIDSVYECNVRGDYSMAVVYADSAVNALNMEYIQKTGNSEPLMVLYSNLDSYAELDWYQDGVDMNYTSLIDLRNEVSLAALSLADRALYMYNNEVFLRLNKLTTIDPYIEEDCHKIASANAGKNLILILFFLLLFIALSIYALMYYRHTVLPVFNMRQLVEMLKRMFTADESQLPHLLHQGISCIRPADAVIVKLQNGTEYVDGEGDCRTVTPLSIEYEGEEQSLGTMAVAYHGSLPSSEEQLIIGFIAKFASIHIFFASVKIEEQKNVIELLEDKRFAAEVERQRLHVQNMVMDNCLSTIKHETMYYPNRILQLLDDSGKENISEVKDVLRYYREVFALLSENANRQLSRSIVKLQSVRLKELAVYAQKTFDRQNKKLMLPLQFSVSGETDVSVRADIVLLQFLLETLLSLAFETKTNGKIELNFEKSGGFIKFALSDNRVNRSEEEASNLFYADSLRYDLVNDILSGTQFLIAKQIIRDHDERLGHPGCRIYSECDKVVFTLPVNS